MSWRDETTWCTNCWDGVYFDGEKWKHSDSGSIRCDLYAEPEKPEQDERWREELEDPWLSR